MKLTVLKMKRETSPLMKRKSKQSLKTTLPNYMAIDIAIWVIWMNIYKNINCQINSRRNRILK